MKALLLLAALSLSTPALADPAPAKPPTVAELQAQLAQVQQQAQAVQNELYAELLAAQKDATMCRVGVASMGVKGPSGR